MEDQNIILETQGPNYKGVKSFYSNRHKSILDSKINFDLLKIVV